MAAKPASRKSAARSKKKALKLSRTHKPAGMALEDWQRELRKQFGQAQAFVLTNMGDHPVYSEFQLANPQSQSSYRLVIRGTNPGENYCSCGDFATNSLGTCKHLEFALAKLQRRHGKAVFERGYQPPYSEVFLQYSSQREVRFRAGGDMPTALARTLNRYFDDDGVLLPAAVETLEEFLAQAADIHEVRCRDDVRQYLAEIRDAAFRTATLAKAFPRGPKSAALKSLMKVPLYDYQAEGALFAARAGRCLIGDEMGLGKTIQALAGAEIMAQHFGVERILILCPTSLKHQWHSEIAKFTNRESQVIAGLRAQREQQFREPVAVKIMNYDTVHMDLDLIAGWAPDLVILDEAQRIKNWSTRVARSVKKITSPYAIVLTGTPLENRLEELVSIVQFVDRFRLGPTFRLLHDHQVLDSVGKVIGYKDLDQLGASLEPILLRRKKDIVADQLPGRLDQTIFVPMTELQLKHHTENKDAVARIVQKWRRFGFLSEADKQRLMICLQNMRMACDSSYLLDPTDDHSVKPDEFATLLDEMLETPGTKVVVFSQWLKMHELIQHRLRESEIGHVLFHGGVPGSQRKELIDRFRDDDACRVFLSTDAGGVGLNLQFASTVVNLDLPWNPAVLEQRIGRVHRLGQRRPVQVVNFVSQGTIEHGMLEVLRFKKSLFAGVLDGGEKDISFGGSRLTKFMEVVEQTTAGIPEPSTEVQAAEANAEPAATAASDNDSPWAGLMQAGLSLLQQFAAPAATKAQPNVSQPTVIRDDKTGRSFLQIPMPKPEVMREATDALQKLLKALQGE
ncbi:MAG: DEAD/DEAH box helicase [Planctomycetota bacterium]